MTKRLALVLAAFAMPMCPGCGEEDDAAPDPVLASDRVLFGSDRSGNYEIVSIRSDGTGLQRLTNDPAWENWWPRVSPDRTRILFYRAPAGRPEETDLAGLWIMRADGTELREIRPRATDGWEYQAHAEWSRDGGSLVMMGGTLSSMHIYVTDAEGDNARQLTFDGVLNGDPSWSPDGATIAFIRGTGFASPDLEIYSVPAIGGTPTQLTFNTVADYDPYYSPDGTRIASLALTDPTANGGWGAWGIRIMDADGTSPATVIDDGNMNATPAWSVDGTAIYFHRLAPSEEFRWRIFSVRPDGTGLAEVEALSEGNNIYANQR